MNMPPYLRLVGGTDVENPEPPPERDPENDPIEAEDWLDVIFDLVVTREIGGLDSMLRRLEKYREAGWNSPHPRQLNS